MKRNFVYTTALSAVNTANSPPLKKFKSLEENNDLTYDDDLLDALGTQALEQFESNSNQAPFPEESEDRRATNSELTSPNYPSSSNGPSNYVNSYRLHHQEKNEDLHLQSALKQIKLLEQKVKQLQYSQVGEVKILREKLNQAEARTKEAALQPINDQSKLKLAEKEKEWAEERKKFEERIASLSSRLQFKEQDTISAAYEKCKCSEQQNKAHKEIPPLVEEMRVQSAIKSTPVSVRCRDAKNAQRSSKNFSTDFPTSDLVKAFSQQQDTGISNGCCNKGKMKARVPQQRHSTSTPLHSTPVVDQETQTPVDVLQHARIEDGIASVELNPSLSMSNRKLFNHLVATHPWLSQSCKDTVVPVTGGLVAHDRDHTLSIEDDKGEEDKINYFISLELPTNTSSSPFLRDPVVWQDVRQSLAAMLGSPHLPTVFPEQNLLPDLGTVGTLRGDSGIMLLLVLEKLVKRYCSERTKGQDGHCRSVESWVSGSLEGLLPSFASLPEEVAHMSRDPMRMDNVQSIICVMEVLLDLVCHSKPVRCHILDNFLGISSKPPLSMDSHCVSMDRKLTDISNSGRITPFITEPVDDGPVAMECDNGLTIKTETPDTSVNSYLKHLTIVPLTGKLSVPRQAHRMIDMTMSLSRKVLIESSSDTSILSVIGNYDDHNFTGGSAAFFTQQGSSDQSSSALHSSNLFSTLLHLMEPYHHCHEEEVAVVSNALQILVILAQDCSEHQMECYQEPKLGGILRCILRRGRPRMCVTVIDLLYHLASSQSVISGICNNSDNCPLLQVYEQLTNPPEPFTDIDIEYGLKVLQMVARSVCTGNKEDGKPMFIFDFDCCCSSELISGLLAFTRRMIRNHTTKRDANSNISYDVISQVILVLLPVIVNQDIGDDITHSDIYKHDYTEIMKGLSTVLLQHAPSSGKWDEAVLTLKELLDYDDLQDCLNTASNSSAAAKSMLTD